MTMNDMWSCVKVTGSTTENFKLLRVSGKVTHCNANSLTSCLKWLCVKANTNQVLVYAHDFDVIGILLYMLSSLKQHPDVVQKLRTKRLAGQDTSRIYQQRKYSQEIL